MSNPFDDDIEQAQKVKDFVRSNGLPILAAVAVAVSGTVGWRWYQDYRVELAQAASEHFHSYKTARGVSEPVEPYLEMFEGEFSKSAYRAFALLHESKVRADASEWEEVLSLLEEALAISKGTALGNEIQIRKARVLVQLERYDEALEVLPRVRGAGYVPRAAELTGDICRVRGENDRAREAYQRALDELSPSMSRVAIEQKLATLPVSE